MTTDTFWILAFCLPTVAILTVLRDSDCDVSTNSSVYGRVGCSEDKDSNATRIEIKNVTANDTRLYAVETGGSLTHRSFLNITESVLHEHKTYVANALSQNAFVIKTWTYSGSTLSVTVKKENKTLLSAFFYGVSSSELENRLLIKYNNITKEVSLLLNNVTRGDEGLYQISTSIYENTDGGSEIIQLNVLEPGEIKQGHIGENILITEMVQELIYFPRLYHNDQLIAILRGSGCDLSTNSSFNGRIRCSENNNKTIIEIKNVTENDTGLYKVETEGSLTQRCFLNITGTYKNSASASIIVTPSESFDETNSDQQSNITLSTNVLSSTVVNLVRSHQESDLSYILPITTVAVFAIILLFGYLIWIQRRKNKRFKAVQRIVLETMETASSAAFSTLGRCPHTPSREEIWTSNSNTLRNTVTNPAERLQYPTPKVSTSGLISCHYKTQQLDDDYYRYDVTDTILKSCESCSRSNTMVLAECHEYPGSLIDVCPFPSDAFSATESATESEEYLDQRICNANDQWQVTPTTETTYAVVKKLPSINNEATYAEVKKLSSRNNVKTVASSKDEYEMVEFSHFDNPTNGVEDVELALVSGTPNSTFVGISISMVGLDHGPKEEETNTIFANVMNHASAENVNSYEVEKALSGRKGEQ